MSDYEKQIKEKLGIMNKEINYLRKKVDRIDGIVTEMRQELINKHQDSGRPAGMTPGADI